MITIRTDGDIRRIGTGDAQSEAPMNLHFPFIAEKPKTDRTIAGFNFDRSEGHDEWLTPPEIIQALGEFDLDPCTPVVPPWSTAKRHFNKFDDGLLQPWEGRVWLNPPYGSETETWLEKLSKHGNGIALIFARTETSYFFDWIWNEADAVLFIRGRLAFYTVEGKKAGTAGAPSVLTAYGQNNAIALRDSGISGRWINLKSRNL